MSPGRSRARVTVCELPGESPALERSWDRLVAHTRSSAPDLVLLPELPFARWLPARREVDAGAWTEAAAEHEAWMGRLPELGVETVVLTRPIVDGGRRYNEVVAWTRDAGVTALQRKTFLPDEDGFWEASWYERGRTAFAAHEAASARIGILVCTEMWFLEHARALGSDGVDVLLVPRATPRSSVEKWVAGGRVAGVVSGAFSASSARSGTAGGVEMSGTGWVCDPEGEVLARTSATTPAVTVELDLTAAREAKRRYPRYVASGPVR